MADQPSFDWKRYRAVKVDIHQTLVRAEHAPELGAPTPGVLTYLRRVQQKGYHIILSCGGFRGGAAEDADFKTKVTTWLKQHSINATGNAPDGKPWVVFLPDERYIIDISDRAVTFRGDWEAMWKETLSRMDNLERTHSPDGPKPKPKTLAAEAEGPGAPPPLAKAS